MSNNQWENGTIVLPAAEFGHVRQVLQTGDQARKEKAFELTQDAWKGMTRKEQTDQNAYLQAVSRWYDRTAAKVDPYGERHKVRSEQGAVLEVAFERLHSVASEGNPARVRKADMEFPTNRTTQFSAGPAEITFDRKTNSVEWDVLGNNWAVEKAAIHPLAQDFHNTLDKVRWTRNTGGVITGGDEYRQEGFGENSDQVNFAVGPIGAAQEPGRCRPYIDSSGKRVTREDLSQLSNSLFQAQMVAERQILDGAKERWSPAARAHGQCGPVHLP